MKFQRRLCASTLVVTALATTYCGSAVGANSAARTVADLSLEELMNIEVVSGSKKPQRIADSASAVFVITADDIRRSGATSIPEALRMAPGVEVAHFGSNKWAVSIRGSNGVYANKLLVLMDGRTLYTPLFAGVQWEHHDIPLGDIERIEIIRGPGAALWGANAVNGVINIITRNAKETQGGVVTAGAGNVERALGTVRYGGRLGDDGAYRVYATGFARDRSLDLGGGRGADDWNAGSAGFRVDQSLQDGDHLLVEGRMFRSRVGDRLVAWDLAPPYQSLRDIEQRGRGAHVLARWEGSRGTVLQGFVDHQEFRFDRLTETRTTMDLEVQHRMPFGTANDVIFGAGYRLTQDDTTTYREILYLDPASRTTQLLSAFVQDEITLVPEKLRATLGARIEHNSFTGIEVQPNARLLWTPSATESIWASASRAVRTPARFEADGRVRMQVLAPFTATNPSPLPTEVAIMGSRSFDSERVHAFEIGYRNQLTAKAAVDVTAFHHRYYGLRSSSVGAPQLQLLNLPPYAYIPTTFINGGGGRIAGIEASAEYRAADWWRLTAYATRQWLAFQDQNGPDVSMNGGTPRHTLSLRSAMNLSSSIELDLWARYVSALPSLGIDSYTSLDARLGWKLAKNIDVSVVGQNLLDARRQEYAWDFIGTSTYQVRRGGYVKLDWKF